MFLILSNSRITMPFQLHVYLLLCMKTINKIINRYNDRKQYCFCKCRKIPFDLIKCQPFR